MIHPHLLTCLIKILEKKSKEKGSSLFLERQGLKFKGQQLTWMFFIHNLKGNTDLESACYCIQQNILDQISVTSSKNFQNAWILQLWELKMNF
jgi:hypothetical protein